MNAEVFVDTNVLLYTIDEDPPSRFAPSGILPMAGSWPARFPSCIPVVGALAYLLLGTIYAGMDRPGQS